MLCRPGKSFSSTTHFQPPPPMLSARPEPARKTEHEPFREIEWPPQDVLHPFPGPAQRLEIRNPHRSSSRRPTDCSRSGSPMGPINSLDRPSGAMSNPSNVEDPVSVLETRVEAVPASTCEVPLFALFGLVDSHFESVFSRTMRRVVPVSSTPHRAPQCEPSMSQSATQWGTGAPHNGSVRHLARNSARWRR